MQAVYYLFLMGQCTGACEVLQRQHQQTPDNLVVMFNLGVVYGRLSRHTDAAHLFEQVLRTDSNHPSAFDGLCDSLHQLGRFEEAATAGTKALALKHASSERTQVAGWTLPTQGVRALAEQPSSRASAT